MPGRLFTDYFLNGGIRATSEWLASVAAQAEFDSFRDGVRQRYEAVSGYSEPNEATTEQEMIEPVLELLGWASYLPQQGAARNEDIPDLLLFPDADSKGRAVGRATAEQRYLDGVAVGESKRFGLPLDARDSDHRRTSRTPHGQMLRYLSTAEIESDGRIRWGILTSGDVWRLYYSRARPRATGYFEADLRAVFGAGDEDALRVFYLLFRRDSFVLRDGAVTTFLQAALDEGRRYEERVAADLSGTVFEKVFPGLVGALADASGADLSVVREASLIFLYRLLFILYAEDRGLLPVNDPRYDDYGLRTPVREDVATRMARGAVFSTVASRYYDHLMTLCGLIDKGDPSIGLPPYNGGLFAEEAAPMLATVRLPDATVAPLIHDLSHVEAEGRRLFVSYRDMSVQQLGSLYERLLEREPVRNDDGSIEVRPNSYARKDSGSFFTPQELVDLIVDRTLKPLADERFEAFRERASRLRSDGRPISERRAELVKLDPAEAVLDLKVLDPAMGSGHFLVTAVDFLSDQIADMVEEAPSVPDWLDDEYVSPLVARVEAIRQDIVKRARESGWTIDEAQLTDQAIIRRMVLKRCIYGVDKNPLTVELAKVSLWLHSFTVGAPLSFLDHHLRCGDSLVGLSVTEATEELNRLGGLFASSAIAGAEAATSGMQRIEEMSDADISEVQESATLFRGVEDTTADVRGLLDFLCGLRWMTAGMKKREQSAFEFPLVETLGSRPDDAYALLARGVSRSEGRGVRSESRPSAPGRTLPNRHSRESGNPEEGVPRQAQSLHRTRSGDERDSGFSQIWSDARSIADRERFLHWQVAFPGVWHGWQDASPRGGFDAVIGNPPWDNIEQPEVEWFARRDDQIARASTGAMRKALIKRRQDSGDELALQYEQVKRHAGELRQVARTSGQYPLLSGGRINLYSLFVERAMRLVKPDGLVGLLTPSGIYADRTAARFFKSVSTKGRVASILDFENRKIFFKDVHASFKFCALIFGGSQRQFDGTECAFFMHDAEIVNDPARYFTLAPDDFERVNPNTGTAPIFRTRRDAEITRGVYERHPVLVEHSGRKERRAWPMRFKQGLFNMTSDSHLFRTATQLEHIGFYPVEGSRFRRGEELYLPLYQGRTIGQFDHRANSVYVNPDSIQNPYLSKAVSVEEHCDPNFSPVTRFWIPASEVEPHIPQARGWSFAFRRIARSTDHRTCIAAIIPQVGCGDTLPVLLPLECDGSGTAASLVANLNSLALDYVSRQKVQATHLDWYTVEQLPVIAPRDYDRQFGDTSAREIVRDHVLRLTYTAYDMRPFARDLGYDGEPFTWDEEERRHLRARLDALYFHLYGLSREDAGYVMDTFPIVRRQDESAFGSYRTRDMVLAYMNALSAGDVGTRVAV